MQSSIKHATARVVAQYRGKYRVLHENNEFWAEVTGKTIYKATSQLDFPVVGDLVSIVELGDNNSIIESILPRINILQRKSAGKNDSQPIAANIDTAFIVQSVDHNFNLNRFERYLSIVVASKIKPLLCGPKTYFAPIPALAPTPKKLVTRCNIKGPAHKAETDSLTPQGHMPIIVKNKSGGLL